jgi:hypothetical protein
MLRLSGDSTDAAGICAIYRRAMAFNKGLTDQELIDLDEPDIIFKGVSDYKAVEVRGGSAVNKTVDARRLVIKCGNSTHTDITLEHACAWEGGSLPVLRYPFTIRAGQSNAKVFGPVFYDHTPLHTFYSTQYNDNNVGTTCNACHTYWYGPSGPDCHYIGAKHLGGWDGIVPSWGRWTDGTHHPTTFDRMYATHTRDDIVEADGGAPYIAIDCLFDGTGPLSQTNDERPDWATTDTVLNGVLWRQKIDLGKATWTVGRGRGGPDTIFKHYNATQYYTMINCVCAVSFSANTAEANVNSQVNRLTNQLLPGGGSTGNKFLWMNVDPPLPTHIALGNTPEWDLVVGQEAVDLWISLRDDWLERNGGLIPKSEDEANSPTFPAEDAAFRAEFTALRTEWFASHLVPMPPQGYDPEFGFTAGPTSGTFTLTDYGFNLGLYALRCGFSIGLKITPNSSNMNGTILTLGHIVLSVAGDVWTLTTEDRTESVTYAYSSGVQLILMAATACEGTVYLSVGIQGGTSGTFFVDDLVLPDDKYYYNAPVVTGTFGPIAVDAFRLAPWRYPQWYLESYWRAIW